MRRGLIPIARASRWARALSLDVVLGAAGGGLLAEHATGARLGAAWWLALLATVWVVYATDHLLDARPARGPLLAYRHRLHRRHARELTRALGVAVALAGGAALALPPRVLAFGAVLLLGTLLYLASAQGLWLPGLPKEPVAALFYAAGIWGGPLLMAASPGCWAWLAAGLHALAALLNLVAYGVFESTLDLREGSRSLALAHGRQRVQAGVLAAGALGTVLTLASLLAAPHGQQAVFAVLTLLLATPPVMLAAHGWFVRRERYRIWGDLVFVAGAAPWLALR